MKAKRQVVRLLSLDDVRAKLLPPLECQTGATATDPVYRLLDTALQRFLPDAFEPLPGRVHGETGTPLPPGPGPFGSGFLALGAADAPMRLRVTDWRPPGPHALGDHTTLDPEVRLLLRESGTDQPADDSDAWYDEETGDEPDEPHRIPGAWQELLGPTEALRGYLYRRFHRDTNDLDLNWRKDKLAHLRRIGYVAGAKRLVDNVLNAFAPATSRYFHGQNAGWDRHHEDHLAYDIVLAALGEQHLLLMYLYYHRWYG